MYFFRTKQINEASKLVMKYHYSHRMPANIQFCFSLHESGGLFGDIGPIVATALFSIPPTRWSEDVLELSRLVRKDEVNVQLTWLISRCCKYLRKKGCDLIVSYADNTQDHHGGIYQASSWNYHGMREKRIDGIIVNGSFVPNRTCNSRFGTQSLSKLRKLNPLWTIEPHYDEGKYLYWKALNKIGVKKSVRLGLKKESYPKPDREGDQ